MYHHTIELTEAVEVGRIETTVVTLKSCQDVVGRNASALTLGSIYINGVFGEVGIEGRLSGFDFGTLGQFCDKLLGDFVELLDVATRTVLQVERKTIGHTITHNHRRLEEEHLCILKYIARTQIQVGEGHRRTFLHTTLAPVLEFHDEGAVRGTLATDEAVTRNERTTFYVRNGAYEAVHLIEHTLGLVLRCTRSHGHNAHDGTRIFGRHKRSRRVVHHEEQTCDAGHHDDDRNDRALDEDKHEFLVALKDALVTAVEGVHKLASAHTCHGKDTDDNHNGGQDNATRGEEAENHTQHCDDG